MRLLSVFILGLVVTTGYSFLADQALAQSVFWMHDNNRRLGTVDLDTGDVTVVGAMSAQLSDIAFAPDGRLYGLNTTSLFEIDLTTAALTEIGVHGVPSGNALVFGEDGTLYAAGGATTSLFELDPATGIGSNLGNIGFASSGDLAFNNGNLYMSSTSNELILIDLQNTVGGTSIGPFGYSSVYGLFTDVNGQLYGLSNTSVLRVDTSTGTADLLFDYAGSGLSRAFGAGIFSQYVVPESLQVINGLVSSGGAGELSNSDDQDLSLVRSTFEVESRTRFVVRGTSPLTTPHRFQFIMESSVFARGNVVQTIELFDFNADQWVIVDTRNATRSPAGDLTVSVAPTGDVSRFIQPGTMTIEARIQYRSDSARQQFSSNTDVSVWLIGN